VELLIDVTKFYLIAKKYHPQSYIKLIMMISVMEKLVNQKEVSGILRMD
jgi:hypothetical protein